VIGSVRVATAEPEPSTRSCLGPGPKAGPCPTSNGAELRVWAPASTGSKGVVSSVRLDSNGELGSKPSVVASETPVFSLLPFSIILRRRDKASPPPPHESLLAMVLPGESRAVEDTCDWRSSLSLRLLTNCFKRSKVPDALKLVVGFRPFGPKPPLEVGTLADDGSEFPGVAFSSGQTSARTAMAHLACRLP